jgi:ribosomal protein L37AE/L43A
MRWCPKCERMTVEYNERMRAWSCLVRDCGYYEPDNGEDPKAKNTDDISEDKIKKYVENNLKRVNDYLCN